MSAVVVTAAFHPIEGGRESLTAALEQSLAAVHAEDGCELYALHDAEDGTLVLIEKWSSRDALAAHAAGDAVVRLNAAVAPFLVRPTTVTAMTALPAGDARRGAI
ncbi:putative quinol monooxygenase [uncultured Microbacterium sp.]|uniref:putative quinol monooxygenase n=1 Tax=uncultured Microbacterium sp. TaxID=191216 RepID=UPI0025D8613D|nr:antibiotic biosynthesis monooxygenase [uncultured Microbacterium sp.]